jgi:hypothetical protein
MQKLAGFMEKPTNIKILLAAALLLRLVLIPNPGFEADISFWKSWGLAVRDVGIVKGLPLTNFNYPTPFAYVLAGMANIYALFADPHTFNEFWNNANLLFLAIAKSLPIAADFGIFVIFFWLGKNAKPASPLRRIEASRRIDFPYLQPSIYNLLGFLYLLNPLSLLDGALWGQVDSVGIFLFLIAILLVLTKKPLLAGVVYMVAMMTKLQNLIYGPIFFLFIWQYLGFDGLIQAAGGALGAFLTLNFEFIRARNMGRVIGDLSGNYDYFPWLSLNAYNVWWIVSGARGMAISDKIAAIGIVNAKSVGLYMFSATYFLAILIMVRRKYLPSIKHENARVTRAAGPSANWREPQETVSVDIIFRFFTALIIVCAGFFLFQTESHDRYAFPISVFLLLWAPFYWNYEVRSMNYGKNNRMNTFLIIYSVFSILYFYNLHNALIVNYPKNGIVWLNSLNIPVLTIAASVINIAMFVFFLYISRYIITPGLLLVWIGTFVILIVNANRVLIFKKPVPITKMAPIIRSSGYGQTMTNMPVNASFGFPKWGFLSVQYAFYRQGLGTHAPSQDVFDINRQFRTLTTDIGIDTEAGPQGSVRFIVIGDGKNLYSSDIVKRYELPRHVEIDVRGVKTLELVTDDAGNGNFDDHADWLNTMLIPL